MKGRKEATRHWCCVAPPRARAARARAREKGAIDFFSSARPRPSPPIADAKCAFRETGTAWCSRRTARVEQQARPSAPQGRIHFASNSPLRLRCAGRDDRPGRGRKRGGRARARPSVFHALFSAALPAPRCDISCRPPLKNFKMQEKKKKKKGSAPCRRLSRRRAGAACATGGASRAAHPPGVPPRRGPPPRRSLPWR